MPRVKTHQDLGVPPEQECFKVRIAILGCVLHVLSVTEPDVIEEGGVIVDVKMRLIVGTSAGDTIGFIRWADVSAVTWRKA